MHGGKKDRTLNRHRNAFTYRSSKIYRDPGHFHICPVEVIHSLLGCFIAFEADEAHPPLGQDMGICDLKAVRKMIAKLVIGAGWWKTTDKHPGILHLGVLWLESFEASADVESF